MIPRAAIPQCDVREITMYEWDIETINHDGEVEDHYSEDKLRPDMALDAITYGNQRCLVLVRNDADGRHWAHVQDGKLPEFFQCAYQRDTVRVPKRFHTELAKVIKEVRA